MTKSFLPEIIAELWPVEKWQDFTVVVAVSGGADSVALLQSICHLRNRNQTKGKVVVAHVNHGMRATDSDADERFVLSLSEELGVACYLESVPARSRESGNGGLGLEATMRAQRYKVLTRIAEDCGARYLLTGHTQDDQIETVLFRFLRGTGLDGLAGIPGTRSISEHLTLVRPMLRIRRQEILDFLNEIEQAFREDESNASDQFTRNRLRHQALPFLRESFGKDIDQAILTMADHAFDHREWMDRLTQPLLANFLDVRPGRVAISMDGIKSTESLLLKAAIRRAWAVAEFPAGDMTARKWNWLATQAKSQIATDRVVGTLPGNLRVSIESGYLVISATS